MIGHRVQDGAGSSPRDSTAKTPIEKAILPIGGSIVTARPRHPKNAPGPFYVLKDSCISCGAPEAEAPTLMGSCEDADGCYFKKQPSTPDEVTAAINAVMVSCVEVHRYAGTDAEILRRLADAGQAHACDHPLSGYVPIERDRIRFRWPSLRDARSMAAAVCEWMLSSHRDGRIERIGGDAIESFLEFTPFPGKVPSTRYVVRLLPQDMWLVIGRSWVIDRVVQSREATEARWFSSDELERGDAGKRTPY